MQAGRASRVPVRSLAVARDMMQMRMNLTRTVVAHAISAFGERVAEFVLDIPEPRGMEGEQTSLCIQRRVARVDRGVEEEDVGALQRT